MKYLTKEWYETLQKTDMWIALKTSKRAEIFSEEYYNYIYKKHLNEWVEFQKSILTIDIEDVFPEYKESEERYKKIRNYINNKKLSFDEAKEREEFEKAHRSSIQQLKKKLPAEILNMVADIRVLAFCIVSNKVKKAITKYCKEQSKIEQEMIKDYEKYCRQPLKNCENKLIQDINLHDCLITNIVKEDKKYIMELDCSSGFMDIKNIVFDDYKILEEEMNFVNGWCLYEEIYLVDNEYEVHLMIDVPNDDETNLGYLTIKAKNIIFE